MCVLAEQAGVASGNVGAERLQLRQQGSTVGQTVEPGDPIERLAFGQGVGLVILDHLQAMFDRPKPVVPFAHVHGIFRPDMARGGEGIQRIAGAAFTQAAIAPAVDQLMRLGEEFDLAYPAAPLLQVEARPGFERPGILLAYARGQPTDILDSPEIEAPPPDERTDRGQKIFGCRNIAGCGACTDEGGALPCQGRTFIVAQRRIERNRQRADFGGRAQPQIDPENVAFCAIGGKHLDDVARVALRRLARFVPLPPG